MKQFIGVKVINAKPMTRLEYNVFRGWDLPADENPDDAGMLVEYLDGGKANTKELPGYVSWSPLEVFNNAYRATSGLTFGLAIEALKRGAKITRAGWNGKGMFLYHVPANYYAATTQVAKDTFGENSLVPYRAYIAMKTVQNDIQVWTASQTDVLAEDWSIL